MPGGLHCHGCLGHAFAHCRFLVSGGYRRGSRCPGVMRPLLPRSRRRGRLRATSGASASFSECRTRRTRRAPRLRLRWPKTREERDGYEQMIALSDMLTGWALDKRNDPKRSAWLTGVSEGLMAEADQLGPDWDPPEPEKLTLLGCLGPMATKSRPNKRHGDDGKWSDPTEGRPDCPALTASCRVRSGSGRNE